MFDLLSALQASKGTWARAARSVLILGDIMLDEFYYTTYAERQEHRDYQGQNLFLEVGSSTDVSYLPGGAARLAANLAALGLPTKIISVVGDDPTGILLSEIIDRHGIAKHLIVDASRPTTRKLRILSRNGRSSPPIVRLDIDSRAAVQNSVEQQLLACMREQLSGCCAIVINDYGKGLLSKELIHSTCSLASAAAVPIHLHAGRTLNNYFNVAMPFETVFMTFEESDKLRESFGLTEPFSSMSDIYRRDAFYTKLLECPVAFRKLMVLGREFCVGDQINHVGTSVLFLPAGGGDNLEATLLQPPWDLGHPHLTVNVGFNLAAFAGLIYGSRNGNSGPDAQKIATLCAHVHAHSHPSIFASFDQISTHNFTAALSAGGLPSYSVEHPWIASARNAMEHVGPEFISTQLVPNVFADGSGDLKIFLGKLRDSIERRYHCIVRGDAGSGKTHVVDAFVKSLGLSYKLHSAPNVPNIDALLDNFVKSESKVLLLDEFLAVEAAFRAPLSRLSGGIVLVGGSPKALKGRFIIGLGSEEKISPDIQTRFDKRILEFPGLCRSPRELIVDFLNMCAVSITEPSLAPVTIPWQQLLALSYAARDPSFSISRRELRTWGRDVLAGRLPNAWEPYVSLAERLAIKLDVQDSGVIVHGL